MHTMITNALRSCLIAGFCLSHAIDVRAQGAPPGTPRASQPILSDAARLLPAKAVRGMVSSQEAQATRIGVDILRRGGNAVDAAVAVGFALAVTLPRAGNIGGGGFMLVHRAASADTIAIDYRETAPAAATATLFLDEKGEAVPQKSRDSGLAIGTPGTVGGLTLAHRKYGSGRFSLAELIAPAISLARDGIIIDNDLADSLRGGAARLARHATSRAIFFSADRPLATGERLVQSDLAATLSAIAASGPDAFYRGAIAEKIVAATRALGGIMTSQDMADYRVIERQPVKGQYRGYDIFSMPPPSSGGVHLIQILNILEGYDLAAVGAGSATGLHLLVEAMKPAYADRAQFLGDPDRVKIPLRGLIDKAYAASLRAKITIDQARKADDIAAGNPLAHESDQTTHFSIVDADGNAVANTYTLNFSYGVGMVAEGTGVLLNNEMDDFSAKPGAQNAYGLVGSDANSVAPGARPLSSMTPTIIFRNNRLFLVTGSPGGSRIITTTLQVISNVIDHGMNIAEAVAAPRVHHQWRPDFLLTETGQSPDTLRLLEARGHKVVIGSTSGSANSILVTKDGLTGASDPRQRGTLAEGY
ncbi:MAG: gamma-glutamyltransferase [Proteobacteria bacterium ST_bin15]|nr:MAG: gamma-glutamyltransferase [Proteobacteria bacterium ST_bin15]